MHLVALLADVESTQVLIYAGADVHARNSEGGTPIHAAVESIQDTESTITILKALVSHGADINDTDKIGETPLHRMLLSVFEAYGDTSQLFDAVVSHSTDVNARNNMDKTPLHYAARGGYLRWYRDNEITDEKQIQYAFGIQSQRIYTLIAAGADINATDNEGNTPYDIAIANGHFELADVLQ